MASRERIQPQTYWQGKAHTSILSTEFPTVVHLHAIENLPHQSIAYFYFLAWRHCLLHSIHKRDVNLYLIWSKPKWKKELSIEWRMDMCRDLCVRRRKRKRIHIQNEFEKSGKCNLALDYDKWWYGWSVEYVCAFAERMAQEFVVDRSSSVRIHDAW